MGLKDDGVTALEAKFSAQIAQMLQIPEIAAFNPAWRETG